jgi:hypothetical protein
MMAGAALDALGAGWLGTFPLSAEARRFPQNSSESCVDVVDATTIDLSYARAEAPKSTLAAMATRRRRVNISFLRSIHQTSSSLAMNFFASPVRGVLKKDVASPVSITPPRWSMTISPANRRASPRSWVDITTLMPRWLTA